MRETQAYTVLIDGYNVIKRHPAWAHLTLHAARHRLLELLDRIRWPMPVCHVLVVFDGHGSESLPRRSHNAIEVHFATASADTYIQQAIRASAVPARVLVISDDGEILRTAKSHGTRRSTTQWLIQRGLPAPRHLDTAAEKSPLPAATARRITEELAKRWLGR